MLVERMKPIRDSLPANTAWPVLTEACHKQFVDLRATYQFKSADETQYNVYGVTCSEMEVDILTGNYLLKRVDILEDVGESMSPFVDVGQVKLNFFRNSLRSVLKQITIFSLKELLLWASAIGSQNN